MKVRFFSLLKEIDEGVCMKRDVAKLTEERDYIKDEITVMELNLSIEVTNFNYLNHSHMEGLVSEYE